jgi:hypothetical protein
VVLFRRKLLQPEARYGWRRDQPALHSNKLVALFRKPHPFRGGHAKTEPNKGACSQLFSTPDGTTQAARFLSDRAGSRETSSCWPTAPSPDPEPSLHNNLFHEVPRRPTGAARILSN